MLIRSSRSIAKSVACRLPSSSSATTMPLSSAAWRMCVAVSNDSRNRAIVRSLARNRRFQASTSRISKPARIVLPYQQLQFESASQRSGRLHGNDPDDVQQGPTAHQRNRTAPRLRHTATLHAAPQGETGVAQPVGDVSPSTCCSIHCSRRSRSTGIASSPTCSPCAISHSRRRKSNVL